MKETKRRLVTFSFYDQKSVEKQLEQMAAQGWMLETPGGLFWVYQKVPPQSLRFAVTYFPSASQLDPTPLEGQLIKEDFCNQDGWRLVARWDAMQIFCTERPDAVPIETDPVTQVENIYQTMKKKVFTQQFLFMALLLYFLFFQFMRFWQDPVDTLSSSYSLFSIPFWVLLLLAVIYEISSCFLWHGRAKKAAEEDGVFLPIRTNRTLGHFLLLSSLVFLLLSLSSSNTLLLFVLIWIPVLGGSTLLIWKLSRWMKGRGFSRRRNLTLSIIGSLVLTFVCMAGITIPFIHGDVSFSLGKDSPPVGTYEWNGRTFEIYDDPLPLEVEDLNAVEAQWSKEASHQESFLLSHAEYSQDTLFTSPDSQYCLHYEIMDVKAPFLYDVVKQGLLRARQDEVHDDFVFTDHYEPVDPSPWKAEEAYQLHWSDSILDTYLVCWDTRIVEITFFWAPTLEEIQTAAAHLKDASE